MKWLHPIDFRYFLLVFLGLLLNMLKLTILPSIDFLFGGIFIFVIVRYYGVIPSILAAITIYIPMCFFWHHSYSIIVYALEALIVCYFKDKYNKGLIVPDALFWVFMGIPLICILFPHLLEIDLTTSLFIGLRDFVNSIVNILIASSIIFWAPFSKGRIKSSQNVSFPLSRVIFSIILACILIPILCMSQLNSYLRYHGDMADAEQNLTQETKQISRVIELWVDDNFQDISDFAKSITPSQLTNPEELREQILTGNLFYFDVICILRNSGKAIVTHPKMLGESQEILNYFESSNLEEFEKTSTVFTVQMDTSNNIFVNVPLSDTGSMVGSVIGVLNLNYLLERLKESSCPHSSFTLKDLSGKVILSTDSKVSPLDEYIQKDTDIRFYPDLIVPRDKAYLSYEHKVSNKLPLILVAEKSLKPIIDEVREDYSRDFMIMIVFTFLGFVIASLLSSLVKKPLSQLAETTVDLPNKIINQNKINWSMSKIMEISELTNNFKEAAQVLQENFVELNHLNSELIKEDEQRRQVEEKYGAIFNNGKDAIYVYKLSAEGNSTFIDFNYEFIKLIGHNREDLLKINVKDIVASTEQENIVEILELLSRTDHIRYEGTLRDKWSNLHPVEVNARVFTYKDERVVISIARDICAQKETQRALIQQLEFHDLAARLSIDFNKSDTDIDFVITEGLRELSSFYGSDLALFLKAEPSGNEITLAYYWSNENIDILSIIPSKYSRQCYPLWFEGLERLEPITLEKGNFIFEEWNLNSLGVNSGIIVPLVYQSNLAGSLALWTMEEKTLKSKQVEPIIVIGELIINALGRRDKIRQIQKNEVSLRALINAIPDALFRVNDDGKILESYTNNDFIKIHEGNFVGKYLYEVEVLPPSVKTKMIAAIAETMRTRELHTLEYTIHPKDQTMYEEVRIMPFGPYELLLIVRNVTQQRRLEHQMIEMTKELDKANQVAAMGIMGGSIAHEINQPLQAIQMTASRMVYWRQRGRELDVNTIVDEFVTISEQVDRITDIIDDIRSLSQGVSIPLEPIELNALLNDIVINYSKPSESSVSIETDFEQESLIVYGNKGQLKQAIQNLISNAIEAVNVRPKGPRQIIVSTKLEQSNAVIEVCDSGFGVPATLANKIFEPFYSTKGMKFNMGLGLAIADRIITAHQGTIRLIKNDNNGATFRIVLPCNIEKRSKHEDITC